MVHQHPSRHLEPSKQKLISLNVSELQYRCPVDLVANIARNLKDASGDDEVGTYPPSFVGQESTLASLRLGLGLHSFGYNIYLSGFERHNQQKQEVQKLLSSLVEKDHGRQRMDHVLVYNFKEEKKPMHIMLPVPGSATRFQSMMKEFVESARVHIRKLLESDEFEEKKKKLISSIQKDMKTALRTFEQKVKEHGLAVVDVEVASVHRLKVMPVMNGKPVGLAELQKSQAWSAARLKKFSSLVESLNAELEDILKRLDKAEKKQVEAVRELTQVSVKPLVENLIKAIQDEIEEDSEQKLSQYLSDVLDFVLQNIKRFTSKVAGDNPQSALIDKLLSFRSTSDKNLLHELQVNVLVDRKEHHSSTVMTETRPSFKNLFGHIEREVSGSTHMNVYAGSLLKANGGVLVLDAIEVLSEPGVWITLKRVCKTGSLAIENMDTALISVGSSSITVNPQEIPIDVKICLLGDERLYFSLAHFDPDFGELFKVKANMNATIPRTVKAITHYAAFLLKSREKNTLPLAADALAELINYSVTLSGHQDKLNTKLSSLVDLMNEAAYWSKASKADEVTCLHIQEALKNKVLRVNHMERRIQEMIIDGSILIDVAGSKVGQVNALSVYSTPDYAFGKPSRITCATSPGDKGVINIERESKLGGKLHNKGVLILTGYMRHKYAVSQSLPFSASICFEQVYGGVDGDSASSTELYAVLSSLSRLPLRQDLAVTGSVNQRGEIQPVGGVTEKIAGFYYSCKSLGLTGKQGVIIPSRNKKNVNLMLHPELLSAIQNRQFHIFAVNTIDEGLELLTGVSACSSMMDSKYRQGTIHRLVSDRLFDFQEKSKVLAKL